MLILDGTSKVTTGQDGLYSRVHLFYILPLVEYLNIHKLVTFHESGIMNRMEIFLARALSVSFLTFSRPLVLVVVSISLNSISMHAACSFLF